MDPDRIQEVRTDGTQTYVFIGQTQGAGHAPILTGRFQVAWKDMKKFNDVMDAMAAGPKK
jgi:hypothetical protein